MLSKTAMLFVAMALAFGAAAFTPTASRLDAQPGFTLVNNPCQFERAPDLCQADVKVKKASKAGKVSKASRASSAARKTGLRGGRKSRY